MKASKAPKVTLNSFIGNYSQLATMFLINVEKFGQNLAVIKYPITYGSEKVVYGTGYNYFHLLKN